MNPVTPVKAWPDRHGVLHPTIEQWRVAELHALLSGTDGSAGMDGKCLEMMAIDLANGQAEALLQILTTGPRSRPKGRKAPGTTNPVRAARKRATPAQAAEGFKQIREAVKSGVVAAPDLPTPTGTNETRDADVPAEPGGVV